MRVQFECRRAYQLVKAKLQVARYTQGCKLPCVCITYIGLHIFVMVAEDYFPIKILKRSQTNIHFVKEMDLESERESEETQSKITWEKEMIAVNTTGEQVKFMAQDRRRCHVSMKHCSTP